MSQERRRLPFICGSLNQTTQMHQIALEVPECVTVVGNKLAGHCFSYLRRHGLDVDYRGRRGPYDLVVTCSFAGLAMPQAVAS